MAGSLFKKTGVRWGLLVAGGYLALTLAMTFPLWLRFFSFAYADRQDGAMFVRDLWWMKYSLLDLHQSPLSGSHLFYPDDVSLAFHSLPKVLGLLGIPLQYLLGLAAAYNLIFIFTFVGSGLAAYWLVYHLLHERLPAFLAGAIFAFCTYRWGQWSHLNLLATALLPIYVLLIFRGQEALQGPGARRAAWRPFALAGVTLALMAYDNEQHAIFLILFSLLFALFYAPLQLRRAGVRSWLLLLAGLALSFALSAVLYLPMFIAAWQETLAHGDYSTFPMRETWPGADLYSFVIPRTQFLGPLFAQLSGKFPPAEDTFMGWTALLLAGTGLISAWRQRTALLMAAAWLLFAALALGPYVTVAGEMQRVPAPYILFAKIPLFNEMRTPARFTLIAMLALAILAGYGCSAIARRLNRLQRRQLAAPALGALVLLALFVEYKPAIGTISTVAPPVYREIAASHLPGAVISLPFGRQSGDSRIGNEQSYTELYQTVHRRPMIGGQLARAPREAVYSLEYTPVLDYLADPVHKQPQGLDLDPQAIGRALERYQVAFIVVNKLGPEQCLGNNCGRLGNYDAAVLQRLDGYITAELGMERFEDTDEVTAYRRR